MTDSSRTVGGGENERIVVFFICGSRLSKSHHYHLRYQCRLCWPSIFDGGESLLLNGRWWICANWEDFSFHSVKKTWWGSLCYTLPSCPEPCYISQPILQHTASTSTHCFDWFRHLDDAKQQHPWVKCLLGRGRPDVCCTVINSGDSSTNAAPQTYSSLTVAFCCYSLTFLLSRNSLFAFATNVSQNILIQFFMYSFCAV